MSARKIDGIIVHCAATKPNQDIGAKDIDRWHRQRGWLMIGYHYVIKRDGTVETGRPIEKAGAHVEGHNANTIGICMAGGINNEGKAENNFTEAQFASLAKLVKELKAKYPTAFVKGHRDFTSKKECPSFDVGSWWQKVTS